MQQSFPDYSGEMKCICAKSLSQQDHTVKFLPLNAEVTTTVEKGEGGIWLHM